MTMITVGLCNWNFFQDCKKKMKSKKINDVIKKNIAIGNDSILVKADKGGPLDNSDNRNKESKTIKSL